MDSCCPRCHGPIGDQAFTSYARKITYCSVDCYRADTARADVKRWPLSGGRPSRRGGITPARVSRLRR